MSLYCHQGQHHECGNCSYTGPHAGMSARLVKCPAVSILTFSKAFYLWTWALSVKSSGTTQQKRCVRFVLTAVQLRTLSSVSHEHRTWAPTTCGCSLRQRKTPGQHFVSKMSKQGPGLPWEGKAFPFWIRIRSGCRKKSDILRSMNDQGTTFLPSWVASLYGPTTYAEMMRPGKGRVEPIENLWLLMVFCLSAFRGWGCIHTDAHQEGE